MSAPGFELDDRLRALRDVTAEFAADLRSRALAVDTDPDDMKSHLDSPALNLIRTASMPEAYRTAPLRTDGWEYRYDSCLERVVGLLEMARGDAGLVLACPGPALAGVVVDALGSDAQRDVFYRRIADGGAWTFFAMTEAARGNDATAMETRLDRDGDDFVLRGGKRYIGNGARGDVGVVFARTGRGALSIRAVLVDLPAPGWHGMRLDMIGLRGAYLSELTFDGVPIPRERLLGEHLPVSRRGMWGAIQTFNNVRVQVAAMAVGTALAMHDVVTGERPGAPGAERVACRLAAARALIYEAAAYVDGDPDRGYLSSAAKLTGTRLAVDVARWAGAALGPASLVEHPLLEKWTRDVSAFEFMEGTSNIQRLHVAQGYLKGAASRA